MSSNKIQMDIIYFSVSRELVTHLDMHMLIHLDICIILYVSISKSSIAPINRPMEDSEHIFKRLVEIFAAEDDTSCHFL